MQHLQRALLAALLCWVSPTGLSAQLIFPEPFPGVLPEPFPGILPEPLPGVLPEPPPPPPPEPEFIRGDINQDGEVDYADVNFLVNYNSFGGPAPKCLQTADVFDDNRLNFTLAPMFIFNPQVGNGSIIVPSDLLALAGWTTREIPQPPPPFPSKGSDPNGPAGACESYSIDSPGGENSNWKYEWTFQTDVEPGANDVPFYLLGTTRAPISGFSVLYRFDRRLVKHIEVDLAGTHVPTNRRQALLDSPLVQVVQTDSAHNNFGLLAVTVIYGLPTGGQGGGAGTNLGGDAALDLLDIRPTRRRITQEILLRVLISFKDSADTSSLSEVMRPAATADLDLLSIRNSFFRFTIDDLFEAIFATAEPTTIRPGGDLFFRGDFNESGGFDIADPMATLNFLFNESQFAPRCLSQADSNGDGDLNIADALFSLLSVFDAGPNPRSSVRRTCAGPDGLLTDLSTFDATQDSACDGGQVRCVAPAGEDPVEWHPVADEPLTF